MGQIEIDDAAYRAADTYERFFVANIFRYWTPLFLQFVSPLPGERVLDVACGTGVVARSVVPLVGGGGYVAGVDRNTAMLEVACKQHAEHCEQVDWWEGRAEQLAFPDQHFDLVTCQQGLQFFTDRAQAVREMYRVLHVAGRVGIAVWQPVERHPLYRRMFAVLSELFSVPAQDLAAAFAFGDENALEQLLVDAGFKQSAVKVVSHAVYFPDPDVFLAQTIRAASAVIPAFAQLDAPQMAEQLAEARSALDDVVKTHVVDGVLQFPMFANFAGGIRR